MNRRNLLAVILAAPLALLGIKAKPKPKTFALAMYVNRRGCGKDNEWVHMAASFDFSKDGKLTLRQGTVEQVTGMTELA